MAMETVKTLEIHIEGRVQGVGMRPVLYRLAISLGLDGWVRNQGNHVVMCVRGAPDAIDRLRSKLPETWPQQAQVERLREYWSNKIPGAKGFTILPSLASSPSSHALTPDLPLCAVCESEWRDPGNRRFAYPFIHCSDCGPRYSLLESLPYDRSHTTMAAFTPCPACEAEYNDPANRRFHAQNICCPQCGPRLSLHAPGIAAQAQAALNGALDFLRDGKIVAVKAVGGYHLMVDARNESAISRLRQLKKRLHKPLAVLASEDSIHSWAEPNEDELELLRHPARPIVLCSSKDVLPTVIAPGLNRIGIMLPGTSLQLALVEGFGGPLVATSANFSGQPLIYEDESALGLVGMLADAVLSHDRKIVSPQDDSLMQVCAGRKQLLRPGRGISPQALNLPEPLPSPVLAAGAHMKSTVALAEDGQLLLSAYVGDLDGLEFRGRFYNKINNLLNLSKAKPTHILCDMNPAYASHQWAKEYALDNALVLQPVWHHFAHASSVFAGQDIQGDIIAFCWDGLGLGADGTLWGGEALVGSPGRWRRKGTFKPLRLQGGDNVARQSWRSALALVWQAGQTWSPPILTQDELNLFRHAWEKGVNCHNSSAVGRLFDAAASLLDVAQHYSYEGQGPMLLEALAEKAKKNIPLVNLPVHLEGDLWVWDPKPLVAMLCDQEFTPDVRALCFHRSLAQCLLEQARLIRQQCGIQSVGLAGGVFQNKLLLEQALTLLVEDGFECYLPILVNDAGLAVGQVMEFWGEMRGQV